MNTTIRRVGAFFLALLCLSLCFVQPAVARRMDGQILAQKVYERDGGRDSYARVKMVLVDKRGNKRTRLLLTANKDFGSLTKTYIRFTSPAAIKGTAFLTWEYEDRDDDQFLYLPALRRVRRIVARQKKNRFVNTDYTYEDMQDSVARIAAGAVPVVLEVIARIPELEHTCGHGCTGEPYDGSYTSKTKKLSLAR